LRFKGQRYFNALVFLAPLAVAGYLVFAWQGGTAPLLSIPVLIAIFCGCGLLFGIFITLPIGGADMPVVSSIYNALTGLAVALDGFVLQNPALMIAGMVVGQPECSRL
jgi:NAD(P) transhydrogenase subunit beta